MAEAKAETRKEPVPAHRRGSSWLPERRRARVIWYIAAVVAILAFGSAAWRYSEYRDNRAGQKAVAQEQAISAAEVAAAEVSRLFQIFTDAVSDLAEDLTAEIRGVVPMEGADPVVGARGDPIPRLPAFDPLGIGADAPPCDAGLEIATWKGIERELCARAAQVPNVNGLLAAYAVREGECPLDPQTVQVRTDLPFRDRWGRLSEQEWNSYRQAVSRSPCYQPYALIRDGELRLRWPHVERHIRQRLMLNGYECNQSVDDPKPCQPRDWYEAAVVNNRPVWVSPRFGGTSLATLGFYSAPFHDQRGTAGVILGTFRVDDLVRALNLLPVSGTGYPMIFDEFGVYVSHPERSRAECRQRLTGTKGPGTVRSGTCGEGQFEYQPIDPAATAIMTELYRSAVSGGQGLLEGHVDVTTGERAWIVYRPITYPDDEAGAPPWTFASVVFEDEVLARTEAQNRLLLQVGLGALLGLFAMSVLVIRPRAVSRTSLWTVSATGALAAALGIGWIWALAATAPRAPDPLGQPGERVPSVIGRVDVICPDPERAEAGVGCVQNPDDETEVVRAGVFVQSIEFVEPDIVVTGFVWQEYRGSTEDRRVGFVLPEAESAEFTLEYDEPGPPRRVGWSFRASFGQSVNAARYPFDQEDVWLRLWPAEFGRETLLVQDVPSYQILAPPAKPGLAEDLKVDGWAVEASSFSHRSISYNTRIGPLDTLNPAAGEYKPELFFTISLRRDFLDPFLSFLVPLLVVWLMLFGVLLASSRKTTDEDFPRVELPLVVLGFAAGLFFVVILSQIDLRRQLEASSITYLEFFHLATYLAIFGVSLNSLLMSAERGGQVVHYGENIIPELAYWPALLVGLLLVTLVTFY